MLLLKIMFNPLISIIIPVYNVEDYITDCLNSILIQDYLNLEIILVNDATPDNSISIAEKAIESLKEKYKVIIINHESNKGLSAARNTGINASRGDYLFFIDSDDELYPNSIKTFINTINNKGLCDVVIGKYSNSYNYSFKTTKTISGNFEIIKSFLNDEWYEMAWNKLIHSKLFKKFNLRFYEGILREDSLFSYDLSLLTESLAYNDNITYKYRSRDNSIMLSSSDKNINDSFFVYEKIMSNFNMSGLDGYFKIYVIQKCYYLFKTILHFKKDVYIAKIRYLLRKYSNSCKVPLEYSIKSSLIKAPFLISKFLFLTFNAFKYKSEYAL